MNDLLAQVLERHGRLEQWRAVRQVDLRLSMKGRLFDLKGRPDGLPTSMARVDAHTPQTLISPFPHRGSRGLFLSEGVSVRAAAGEITSTLQQPRASFAGYGRQTPWSDLQWLYFLGYAFWNYFTAPFLLAWPGVVCEEITPWDEHGEIWRVLQANFPEGLDTHCPQQRFYFDSEGLLRRQDYTTEVGQGVASHYMFDHATFDGFVFPTRRRVVARDEQNHSRLSGPSTFTIDIEDVVVSLEPLERSTSQ